MSFSHISLKLGGKPIFSDVSFDVHYKGLVLIKGRTGSGKTTLLKMIARVISPDSGSFIHRNLKDNSDLMGVYIHSQPEFNFITGYVRDELTLAGLDDKSFSDFADRSIYDMSGGELKKLALLMAAASGSDRVILADEPLDMLDDVEAANMSNFIIEASKKRPFIIAAHDDFFDSAADAIIEL